LNVDVILAYESVTVVDLDDSHDDMSFFLQNIPTKLSA